MRENRDQNNPNKYTFYAVEIVQKIKYFFATVCDIIYDASIEEKQQILLSSLLKL